MHIALTEEQSMIQQAARKVAEAELVPVAAELDQTGNTSILLHKLKKLAKLGFMGLNIRSEYGGVEAGVVAFSLAVTEIARGCASTAVSMSVTSMVAEVIQAVGTEQQKKPIFPKFVPANFRPDHFACQKREQVRTRRQ